MNTITGLALIAGGFSTGFITGRIFERVGSLRRQQEQRDIVEKVIERVQHEDGPT